MLDAEPKVQAGVVNLRQNMTIDEVLEEITSVRLNDRTVPSSKAGGWNKLPRICRERLGPNKFIKAVREEDWQFRFPQG